ncbi:MAG: hypothetical protein CMB77_00270 [Euryarchaeota archaeon]|nr:hypothetical protein [Euryarchaeota archaeon]
MTLEKLADKIAAASEEKANKVIAEAKAEAKRIESAAKEEAAEIVEQLKSDAEQDVAQLSTEMIAAARQNNQKQLLIVKREELDLTWQSVFEQVGSAGMKGRSTLLKALMADATEKDNGNAVLRPVAMDRKAIEVDGRFKMGEDIDGLGGFVLEFDEGAVSLDYRFESRLQTAWDENLAAVTGALFSD